MGKVNLILQQATNVTTQSIKPKHLSTSSASIKRPSRNFPNPTHINPPLYTSVNNMSTNVSESGSIDRVPFKQENSLEKRTRLAAKIRAAHPDRVPVIVEKHARSKLIPDISKRKFLAPGDIAVTQLISEIRKHIELRPGRGHLPLRERPLVAPVWRPPL